MKDIKKGLFPDSFIKIVENDSNITSIDLIDYTESVIIAKRITDIEESRHYLLKPSITWLNIIGLKAAEQFHKIYEIYKVHPLVLENIIKANQRPQISFHEDYTYITLYMLYLNDETKKINVEQISLIFGKDYLLSFQELEGDVFNEVRNILKIPNGRLRKHNSDYLCYYLIDGIINNYNKILDDMMDKIEYTQDYLINQSKQVSKEDLFFLKNNLAFIRKHINPLQDIIHSLLKMDKNLIEEETIIYFKDTMINVKSIIDRLDNLNDILMGLFDLHLTNKSNELNEIMKVLTMFSVPFMPLSFLAGLYGMNFEYLPELKIWYSYPILVCVMATIFISLIVFFKRKKWF